MAYWLPSFFQKRLLRYALSRLELVDTDALDLERLGIRWGQRSTFELQDIGLKLEKLASILHLPPTCELLKARILLLRVTIPADIYSSGIIVEVEGIDVHLRLPPDELHPEDGTQRGKGPGPSTGDKSDRPKGFQPSVHDPGGDQILPTTTDLAHSFLESEPQEEKAELQAAISSQSQYLHQSSTSLSDDEEELGLGNEGVSLPSFIAGFLKGVADRLQIKVKDVTLRVDMDLRHDGPLKRSAGKPDPITGLLTIREFSVDGVTTAPSSEPGTPTSKTRRRLISLSDVHGLLVSDPVVFSNYSRFAAPPSPTTTHSKASQTPSRAPSRESSRVLSRASSRAPSPPPPPESPSPGSAFAMTRSTIFEQPQVSASTHAQHTEDHGQHMQESYVSDGRFSDAGTEAECGSEGYPEDYPGVSDSQYDDRILDNPAYLDEVFRSQLDDDIEDSTVLPPSVLNPSASGGDAHTPRPQSPQSNASGGVTGSRHMETSRHSAGNGSRLWGSRESLHGHQPEVNSEVQRELVETEHRTPSPARLQDSSRRRSPSEEAQQLVSQPSGPGSSSSQHGSPNEELSESKLFSHEEAESMYMSAVSYASASRSYVPNIPGAWGSPKSSIGSVTDARTPEPSVAMTSADPTTGDLPEVIVSTPKLNVRSGTSNDQALKTMPGEQEETLDPFSPPLDKLTNVSKKVLHIDKISIRIPSNDRIVEKAADASSMARRRQGGSDMKDSVSLSESVAYDELMSSRANFPRRSHQDSTESSSQFEHGEQRPPHSADWKSADTSHPTDDSDTIAVEVASVSIQFDIATGWLLTKMGQRILFAYSGNGGEIRASQASQGDAQSSMPLSFTLRSCSVKFLEHLPGFAYPPQKMASQSPTSGFSSLEDIVLRATVSGLSAHLSVDNGTTKFRLDLSKFAFGFASEDLLSFDESLKMRESTRDILSPVRGDISLSVTKSVDAARVNLTTLPVHLNLNIQRLEEVLGWVGGLSTILELGNSMASVSTVRGAKSEPRRPQRGAHFEPVPSPSQSVSAANSLPWKVNARLGGLVIDLVGESQTIKLKTTAVKIVSRFELIGMQIDKAKISGPFPLDKRSDALAKINLSNIRIEYLYSPKEVDLDRLLSLITPSKDKYEEDDDIMLDTLLRQRRQGAVLRVTVAAMKTVVSRTDDLEALSQLGNELGKLSTVTKYLPEDDRPGILTLALIRELESQIHIGGKIGDIRLLSSNLEVAHISIPSLIAAQIGTVSLVRNEVEELIGEALPLTAGQPQAQPPLPMIMARFIADEMDPTVKVKLYNLRAEYTVPAIVALLGLSDEAAAEDLAANMAKSVVNLTELQGSRQGAFGLPAQSFVNPEISKASSMPSKLAVALRDCVLGLKPRDTPAKALVLFTYAKFFGAIYGEKPSEATLDLRKASLMIIDDVQNVGLTNNLHRHRSADTQSGHAKAFIDMGYVPVSYISSAMAVVKVVQLDEDGKKSLDLELRDNLLILETCADSTQTLINIFNGLKPPAPPSTALKYRTEVMPIQDMLASFSGDAFATEDPHANSPEHETSGDVEDELEYVSDFYPSKPQFDMLSGSMTGSAMAASQSKGPLDSFYSHKVTSSISELEFQDDHFARKSAVGGTAHRWDSAHNTYGLANDVKLHGSPLRVRVRDVHVIWNLFDGYDWQKTRDTISKAVRNVEMKATERRARAAGRRSPGVDEEEESVIGDFLFNSIYIGIPANKDPRELSNEVNRNIDDLVSETGSYSTSTTVTGATARQSRSSSVKGKKLRLARSKHHKMTFELKGVSADLVVFPPGSGETQSSLDVRVNDLEIFDHVPTSTWKKFATYMHDAGERESGTSMVHLEILNVKPVPELAASEIVLKATVLPLRLHVDQDALDFMSRFFEFKDDTAPAPSAPGDIPFLQRVEVNAIRVKLDFKPKRVDYAGLRSGRTTEFMNFFVLDGADMVLRHVIIYGVSGFDKLGQTLNDIWMPDIKRNQLPGVLAGLAPIRSLVNVGSGVKDLVVIPMREYRKDGRIVRSIQKGALAFAKTTTSELVKLGAKLAIGTQTVLQGAEELLSAPSGQPAMRHVSPDGRFEDDDFDEEETKKISLYADQPVGVLQGLRGAFSSLERDLLMARDAIVAVPGEVMESGSATAAAKAVLRRAPTVILRPAIGATKAVGQTLLGAGNTLDPSNRKRMEDKYKRY